MRKSIIAAATALVLASGLAACSQANSGSSSNTKSSSSTSSTGASTGSTDANTQACKVLENTYASDFKPLQEKYNQSALTKDDFDPKAMMKEVEEILTKVDAKLPVSDVKTSWSDFTDIYTQSMTYLEQMTKLDYTDSDAVKDFTSKTQKLSDRMDKTVKDLEKLCPNLKLNTNSAQSAG